MGRLIGTFRVSCRYQVDAIHKCLSCKASRLSAERGTEERRDSTSGRAQLHLRVVRGYHYAFNKITISTRALVGSTCITEAQAGATKSIAATANREARTGVSRAISTRTSLPQAGGKAMDRSHLHVRAGRHCHSRCSASVAQSVGSLHLSPSVDQLCTRLSGRGRHAATPPGTTTARPSPPNRLLRLVDDCKGHNLQARPYLCARGRDAPPNLRASAVTAFSLD